MFAEAGVVMMLLNDRVMERLWRQMVVVAVCFEGCLDEGCVIGGGQDGTHINK
jgi:hypothetical protein